MESPALDFHGDLQWPPADRWDVRAEPRNWKTETEQRPRSRPLLSYRSQELASYCHLHTICLKSKGMPKKFLQKFNNDPHMIKFFLRCDG